MSKQPPVTQIKQGDTCQNCPWIIRGSEQQTKGTFDWGCKFYHTSIGFHKPYPPRLPYCDIDGRITAERHRRNKEAKKKIESAIKETSNNETEI